MKWVNIMIIGINPPRAKHDGSTSTAAGGRDMVGDEGFEPPTFSV